MKDHVGRYWGVVFWLTLFAFIAIFWAIPAYIANS